MENIALKLLENNNCKIDLIDKYGDTPLIWACERGMINVALKLIQTLS